MNDKMRVFGLLLLCLVFGGVALGQENKGQQIARIKGGGFVSFKTTTEPASTEEFSFSAAESDSNIVHRVLIDKSGTFYFGYDLQVEPLLDARKFRVRVLPLSHEFEDQLRARKDFKAKPIAAGSKLAPIAQSSAIELLDDGDSVALDVLVNPDSHVKIVDVISVAYDYLALREAPISSEPARDYTLDDVELKVSNYKLSVNGNNLTSGRPNGGYGGSLIWFYVAGKGRFIFSLVSHPGYDFKKIGKIVHNKISFDMGGDHYEWVSNGPVVGTGGNWNVWVLQDSSYVSEFAEPDRLVPGKVPDNKVDQKTSKTDTQKNQKVRSEGFSVPVQATSPQKNSEGNTGASDASSTTAVTRRSRPVFGAADRIENLLPKN